MTSPSEGDALAALLTRAADFVKDVAAFRCVRDQEEGDLPFNVVDYYTMEDLERDLRAARGVRMPGAPEAVREAAQALVDALDRCKPKLDSDAVMAYIHGQRYDGPTFGIEWEALRTALVAARLPREAAP